MTDDDLRQLINDHLAAAKKKNPKYSLRAFCLKAGLSSGAVSLFLNNKRDLSADGYDKLVTFLVEEPEVRKNYLAEFNKKLIRKLQFETTQRPFRELTKHEFAQLKELYAFAFLSLVRTKTFRFDIFWISQRLGITTDTAESLIDVCLRLGLLRIDTNDIVYRTEENIRTPDNLAQDQDFEKDLKEYYQKVMLQSYASITDIPRHLRDITTLTLPANPQKLEKARELIRKFQDDLMVIMEDGAEEEVYRLCVQLYPVTIKVDK